MSERTTYVGDSVARVEDHALLTGRGQFADDVAVRPSTRHAAILRSNHAHARIESIDASAARAARGVCGVLTRDEVKAWSQPFVVSVKQPMQHWCLAVDKVRYAGEPVAVVIAETRAMAEDAAELIEVVYSILPPVLEQTAALAADASLLHEAVGSNLVSDRAYRYGDPGAAFAAAAHRISIEIDYPRNSCTPLECGVVVAEYLAGEDSYDVLSNFMGPFSLHTVMALALKVPAPRLRHRTPRDSGGSFGVKQSVFPYVVLMCLASRLAGAPVKWVEDRLEHLLAATSATGRHSRLAAAVDADGRVLALDYDQIDDVGAYLRAPEPATFYRMHGCLTGAYAIEHLAVRNRVVVTNKTPAGLVRGFGGPQVYFALERLTQRIAGALQIDVLELYRRNFVRREQFPYRAAAGALLDSGDYHAVLERALAAADYADLCAQRAAARAAGLLYGIGFAAVVEPSISNMGYITTVLSAEQRAKAGPKNGAIAAASVAIDPTGGVVVNIDSAPAGQGHRTACAQVVADVFGIKPEDICVNAEFDTHKDAWSVAAGNYSSRFAGATASAVLLAAQKLRARLAEIAAATFGVAADSIEFTGGKIFPRAAPERGLMFARLAASPHWAPALVPDAAGYVLRETAFWTPPQLTAPDTADRVNTSATYGFAFDVCAVAIDAATGKVRIDRYATCHDAGRLINPALADGQVRGGFAQGLGAALLEEFRYAADGSFLSGTFADYLLPAVDDVPEPIIAHLETASPFTPMGSKGIGEGNNMSTPVCIANAVADALGAGVAAPDLLLPLNARRLLDKLDPPDPPPARASKAVASAPGLSGQGVREIAITPAALVSALLDPRALARLLPGCGGLRVLDGGVFRGEAKLGVGIVQARYQLSLQPREIEPGRVVMLSGEGQAHLGSARGEVRVSLHPSARGTRLEYAYRVELSGRLAAAGSRFLNRAADIVIDQVFERLREQIEPRPHLSWWQRCWERLLGKR
jgi:2-furoyl-CoA dehydrogenase large subunit